MSNTGAALWITATHEAVYGSGGWAYARRVGGQVTGAAGGERRTTARRMALTVLAEALKDLSRASPGPAPSELTLHAALPQFIDILAILEGKAPPPEEDLDLWAPVLAAKGQTPLVLVRSEAGPISPIAFLNAWAEFTRQKARAKGQFRAVLPKPNLAGVTWI